MTFPQSMDNDDFLDDVDSAAVDAIEEVKDTLTRKAQSIVMEMSRPSVLYRPILTKTAKTWKVTYSEFQSFGATPEIAMRNFDIEWLRRSA